MRALDLSSIGWEYIEIRGDDPRSLHGEKLCALQQDGSESRIEPNKDVLNALGFNGYSKQGLVYFVRVSANRIENGEIKQLFGIPSLKGFFKDGQNRIEPVQSKMITFSTAETVRPEDLMSSKDQKRGKKVTEMTPEEFKEAAMERRIPLSQIRKLHEVFNQDATLSETAMLSAIQQVRHAFNKDEAKEAIVICTFNGEKFNPPVQIIRDDAFKSPTFYDIQDNYKVAELTVNSLGKADIQSASQAAHKEVRDALLAQAGLVKVHAVTSSVYNQTRAAPNRNTTTETPTANKPEKESQVASSEEAPMHQPKPTAPVISEKNFDCELEDWLPSDFIEEKSTPTSTAEQESLAPSNDQPKTPEQFLTISDFLRTKSILSQVPKDILKTQAEWLAEYNQINPLVKEDTFLMSTRVFFREMIEAYWARIDQKKPWFDANQLHEPISISSPSIKESIGMEKPVNTLEGHAKPDHSPQASPKKGTPPLPRRGPAPPLAKKGSMLAAVRTTTPRIENEDQEEPTLQRSAGEQHQIKTSNPTTVSPITEPNPQPSNPKKGRFLNALRVTKQPDISLQSSDEEDTSHGAGQNIGKAIEMARESIEKDSANKPKSFIPGIPTRPQSAASLLKM